MTNPYQEMSKDKFWRSGVSERLIQAPYESIWQDPFSISPTMVITAAGSCFAQNVGKWFIKNDYNFQLSKLDKKHGFSFATGNIYTPALLLQWLKMAIGELPTDKGVDEKDGLYFDLLRPSFHPEGFATKADLLIARDHALEEIRNHLISSDLFIFTMGLTEAWRHSDGTVYAICPGTIAGTYDAQQHHFHNYSFNEAYSDMQKSISIIRDLKPSIKFMITISPVPLTATASDNHVLPATIYSKSVLRAVAGQLCDHDDQITYFPSYEIITAPSSQGLYFEDNKRSVTQDGVDFVMRHLQEGLAQSYSSCGHEQHLHHKARTEEELCDDALIEQFNSQHSSNLSESVCLIGDSHMPHFNEQFSKKGVSCFGGMIMPGADWAAQKFNLEDDEIILPLNNRMSRDIWSKTIDQLKALSDEDRKKQIIVTNVGLNTRAHGPHFLNWLNDTICDGNFSIQEAAQYFHQTKQSFIQVISKLVDLGLKVVVISDPPLQRFYDTGSEIEQIVDLYEKIYSQFVISTGAEFFHIREWMEAENLIQEALCSETLLANGERDWMHGSEQYYALVTDHIINQYL